MKLINYVNPNTRYQAVTFSFEAYGSYIGPQNTRNSLHREYFSYEWAIVDILRFRTLSIVLGSQDMVRS